MAVTLNHTILEVSDPSATAEFMTELLGLPGATCLGYFTIVEVAPTLIALYAVSGRIQSRHFAFLVSEEEFDAILETIKAKKLPYWSDWRHGGEGEINHWDDGRGLYVDDPDGHQLEIITKPYGAEGCAAKHPHPLLDC